MNPGKEESVFFHTWKDVLPAQEGEPGRRARCERIRKRRARVTRKREEGRAAGSIGSSLQADVGDHADPASEDLLRSHGEYLKSVLIAWQAAVGANAEPATVEVV